MQFKACKNSDEVIAYTDANFSVKRSQTGVVVKLGVNVVAWRSMKQTESSISTAESEVQALASTEVMAEYIRTLRESLCLTTPVVRIKCDNTAAIVLATGEGSWRTKSAANRVYQVKEKVQNGLIEVTYVSTHDQCADSLTKYLKGAESQKKANLQLSLIDLDSWLPGKDLITRAKKVRFQDNYFGIFQPVVKRIFCSGPESFENNEIQQPYIIPEAFGKSIPSVATKAQAVCEYFGRNLESDRCSCNSLTSSRSMVIITCLKDVKDMGNDDWSAGTYAEILKKYDAERIEEYPRVHPVDMLSIATKQDPIPLKDVPENLLDQFEGAYLGESDFVKTLQDDKFFFSVGGERNVEASRWMMLDVEQNWRSRHNDKMMQFYENMVMQSLRFHRIRATLRLKILEGSLS